MNDRKIYLDYLRIFASIAVVMLHSANLFWGRPVNSVEWQVTNFFDSCSRWSVPIFFMISGALFLSKEVDISTIYKKYVKRLVIIFFSWSFAYAFVFFVMGKDIKTCLNILINGYYHEWYLLTAIGLYLITPVIKKIADDKKICEYFLVISFIFSFCFPTINNYLVNIDNLVLNGFAENICINKIPYAIEYYLLGYYLSRYEIKNEKIIYILGFIGLIFTVVSTSLLSTYLNTADDTFYKNYTINVFFTSVSIFIIAKKKLNNPWNTSILKKLTKYTLCIYLVHPLIQLAIKYGGILTPIQNPIIAIIIYFMLSYLISFFISLLLNKIPFISKYFV